MKKLLLGAVLCVTAGVLVVLYHQSKTSVAFPAQAINSYDQIRHVFAEASSDTLIIFDVDDTLIKGDANDPFAHGVDNLPLLVQALFFLTHPSLLISLKWESFYSVVWQRAPRHLIEPGIVRLIKQAHQRGCNVLGLTSMESGSYGIITSFPEWRYAMLHKMGIDFSLTWPDTKFADFPVYRSSKPILYKGILCANQQPKGEVLKALLTTYHIRPSRVIFFDDSSHNLQSVGRACDELQIPCILYQYRGAHDRVTSLSMRVVLQRLNQLYAAYSKDMYRRCA